MAMISRGNVVAWIGVAAAIILASLFSNPALSEEISVRLAVDAILWPDNEVIVGGHIETLGGTIVINRASQREGAYVISSDTMGGFLCNIKNKPKDATGSLELLNVTVGVPPSKKGQQTALSYEWFRIVRANTSSQRACPPEGCPVTIRGELFFDTFHSRVKHECKCKSKSKSKYRKVLLKTSDFILDKKPNPAMEAPHSKIK
jgi:hypothetical protein